MQQNMAVQLYVQKTQSVIVIHCGGMWRCDVAKAMIRGSQHPMVLGHLHLKIVCEKVMAYHLKGLDKQG